MKKRILCALLSAVLLLDVGSFPVGAAAGGTTTATQTVINNNVSAATSGARAESRTSALSVQPGFAYYENGNIVWYDEIFAAGQTYSVIVNGGMPVLLVAQRDGRLDLQYGGSGMISMSAVNVNTSDTASVLVDMTVAGTQGIVKEYPNGKVQAEALRETEGNIGKIILVYADANETNLALVKDSQGSALVDISEAAVIDHVMVVDYRKNPDNTIGYGVRRRLDYQRESLGVPVLRSVSNGECKFTITWNAVPYASKYYVYRTDAQGRRIGGVTVVTTTSYTRTGIKGNEDYYYIVAAVANGRSGSVTGQPSAVMRARPTMKELSKVTSLKATAGDASVKLSWAKTSYATKYIIQRSVAGSNDWREVASTTGTSYTFSDVINGKKYYFRVRAARTVNGYTVRGANATASATPKLVKPTKPTSFTIAESASGYKLSWKSSGKVTGFIVYSYDYDKQKYVKLATVKNATSYIHKGSKNTERYKYAVKAYRNDNGNYYESALVEKIVYGKKLIADTNNTIHPLYYTAYTKKKVGMFKKQNQSSSSQYFRVVKKGTKVTVVRLHPFKPKIRLADGTEGYTFRGALRLSAELYTSKQYTRMQAECFINQGGYGSSTNHLIWIATYPQMVYIFKGSKGNWTLVRSGQVATGAIDTPAYPGENKIAVKQRWHRYGKRFYQYVCKMTGGNAFHTRPAYRSTGRYVDPRLGRPLSHGCVRVTDSVGNYIFYNCPINTKVVIY